MPAGVRCCASRTSTSTSRALSAKRAAATWRRAASSCARASTSARWTTRGCTGPAASAATASSRARWCPRWARPTTRPASCATPADSSVELRNWDGTCPHTCTARRQTKCTERQSTGSSHWGRKTMKRAPQLARPRPGGSLLRHSTRRGH
uniref:Actin binding LIM protein family member 2 n=1 Tax=Rousettus aegyptiacus TaxID=9407 RepID=A0A7J8E5C8_ROUAE|nr:actin binding LIM protein family member 2 [Rousettus aegyptiacus]